MTTMVEIFCRQVQALGDKPALRRRSANTWDTTTWREYGGFVDAVGWSLYGLGMQPGARVGILGANRPEWLYSDIGALASGHVTVPIYPTLIASQIEHIVAHSEMAVLVVDSAAQRDKIRHLRDKCPSLRYVVVLDATAGEGELTWEEFLERGKEAQRAEPQRLAAARKSLDPQGLATIVYTSGTTGPPKGVMLSHRNLAFEAEAVRNYAKVTSEHESLSFLPLSHIAERLQGEMVAIAAGMTVSFARSIDTIRDDLVEVRPTVLTCVPRLWEKMQEAITANVAQAKPRQRAIFAWAQKVAAQAWRRRAERRPVGIGVALAALLSDRLVGAKLRRRVGLDRYFVLISGAAPLSTTTQEFFAGLGLHILEAYGMTECTGIANGSVTVDMLKLGFIGPAIPGIEVSRAADGEILMRGPNVFMGYYKDDAATREALSEDGWLRTGDVGVIDNEGYLKLTDRKKDIIVTAGGKNVAPQNIEGRLKIFSGISQAVVLGDKRKYLVALVTIDTAAMAKQLGRAPQEPIGEDAAVRQQVQTAIDAVNRELSSYETIKRFAILPRDFSIDGGELTPTLKVKRRVIDERYRDVIDGLYKAA